MTNINEIVNSQVPNEDSINDSASQLSIQQVDALANEIAGGYDNHQFHKWYCGVIYEFGVSRVMEWRSRAQEGSAPRKLFSKYVSDARKFNKKR